jgi:hypothetical protein
MIAGLRRALVTMTLTSDHGVAVLPEQAALAGVAMPEVDGRMRPEVVTG